jgi:hypothetical protein
MVADPDISTVLGAWTFECEHVDVIRPYPVVVRFL